MSQTLVSAVMLFGLLVPAGAAGPLRAAGPDPLHAQVALVERELARRAAGRIPERARPAVARAIVADGRRHGLEPSLVMAIIEVESSFRPDAVSPAEAYGLMQIRRRTGLAWARRLGIPWRGVEETLLDPVANVRIGIAYLARLRERVASLPTALAAYNQGPTRVSRALHRGEPVPARYTRRVMRAWADDVEGRRS